MSVIETSHDALLNILRVPAYPEYLNELGHVKAGHLLKLIDFGGSLAAMNQVGVGNQVVTASLDRTNFMNPIRRWELITLQGTVTRTWKSSLECQVNVSAWNMRTRTAKQVATAYLVFVAMSPERQKIGVPALTPATPLDQSLAEGADLRKQNRLLEGRQLPMVPIDSETDIPVVLERVMTQNDSNALNNVFGGVILDIIDEVATQAAQRQALGGVVAGARIDRMSFIAPAFIGETIIAKAVVTKVWRTSMEVQVEVSSYNPINLQHRPIASSYLVYVGMDSEGQPMPVPPWVPQTDDQKKRAEAADIRRDIRKEEEQQSTSVNGAP